MEVWHYNGPSLVYVSWMLALESTWNWVISSSYLEWRSSVRALTLGKGKKRKVEGLQLSTMPCRRKSKHLTQLVLSSVGPWSIAFESAKLPRCLTLPSPNATYDSIKVVVRSLNMDLKIDSRI
ncbi:hypothetical protein NC653_020943 [Populus alba x Populus x berolinensis]|uniref:Uncharacterized protein n=1 Tax=Populus alba x Populus x berolinensis TaxID=444605 RepID=A0AAD6MLZ1_9ROSI|nr:hypothetical protein NC653_020943 [Populus alba x Populus x berolinensis]